MKKAIEIYCEYAKMSNGDISASLDINCVIKAMEEYANQFKKEQPKRAYIKIEIVETINRNEPVKVIEVSPYQKDHSISSFEYGEAITQLTQLMNKSTYKGFR